jgi:hypothetical protein
MLRRPDVQYRAAGKSGRKFQFNLLMTARIAGFAAGQTVRAFEIGSLIDTRGLGGVKRIPNP